MKKDQPSKVVSSEGKTTAESTGNDAPDFELSMWRSVHHVDSHGSWHLGIGKGGLGLGAVRAVLSLSPLICITAARNVL